MLLEVDHKEFKNRFVNQPNPFISLDFLALNQHKVDRLVYFIENKKKKIDIGLIIGIKDNILLSPFSAPFGGFYFRHNNIFINEIDIFISQLQQYVVDNKFKAIKIILPPDLYHSSLNAKMINTLIRNKFKMQIPDIVSWIDLKTFSGTFTDGNSRNNLRKAYNNKLSFSRVTKELDKQTVFKLVKENRQWLDRSIYMTFDDLKKTENLWPIDYFQVLDIDKNLLSAAVFYRSHPKIIYGAFWGDNEKGRSLRAMDFMSNNIWSFYKDLNYSFIDLGTSTESGIPNEGLLRFKETHEGTSSLRFSFKWSVSK